MCIIIAKKAGVNPVPREYLERAWEHNSHGGGVVFFRPGDDSAYMKKGIMDKDEFLGLLDRINTKENSFIAHFRISSKGSVRKSNTHPFTYEHITFAHNGTLSGITPTGDKTDTETYGDQFFVGKTINWIKASKDLIEFSIGYSKFAVMDNHTGEIVILNEKRGTTKDEVWYSNESAFDKWSNPTSSYTDYYKNGGCSGAAASSTTGKALPLNPQAKTQLTPSQIEAGVVECIKDFEMMKYRLGTPYWHPNMTGMKYDPVQKHWVGQGGVVFGPEGYTNIIFSREGLYKLCLLDSKDLGLEYVSQNRPQGKWVSELRKQLWDTYKDKLADVRKQVHYEDIDESAEEARTIWLLCNTIHKMVSSNILVTMSNLNKLLFQRSFMLNTITIANRSTVNIDSCLDALQEECKEYFLELSKKYGNDVL